MRARFNECDLESLRLLADDRLASCRIAELEDHLETCGSCRAILDDFIGGDDLIEAARHYLGSESTGWHVGEPAQVDLLSGLAPTDWPDSLGRMGTYEIKGVIGRGGMGVVLKAFDPALNRTVAIKVLSASMATCGAARRRFLREARAAAAVAHEHVVAVHAVVESAGLPFLVMEYVPGRSLQERLDNDGPLRLEEILRIGMQTAAGLAAAHAQGLVHRDVKPANILLENGVERVRLTDFGLARAAADASVTQSGLVAGTPHYMSPEQARGEATDHRADLFSLGSTLYAMCTGHPPFRADSAVAVLRRVSDDQPRPVREINAELPEWLEAIISRLHAKSPAERFQSAAEVADLLSRCLAHTREPLSVALPAAVSSPDLRRNARRRHNLKWAALVLAAPLVVVIAMAAPAWRHLQEVPSEANLVRPGDNAMDLHSSQSPAHGVADDFEAQLEAARKRAAMIEQDLNAPSSSTVASPLSVRIRDLATEARLLEQELVTGSTVAKH
jgi:serine/threonine protein kinase